MRKLQSAILITAILLMQLAAFAQAPAICNLTGTAYNPDGTLAAGAQFRVSKISKNSLLISQGPFVYTTSSYTITNATNASPIVITVSAAETLQTGDKVSITGVQGNTAANNSPTNPTWTITVVDSTHFSLNSSTGNGAFSGGTAVATDGVIRDAQGNPNIALPQGSAAYIYSVLPPWNVTGGVAVNIPNSSSVALGSLATVAAVPVTGATVQTGSGPTTLTNKEGTFWFTSGLKATETSPGIAKIEIDTSSTAIVPGTRTIAATNPVRIDGGASADMSSNRTISLNGLSGLGTANQFLGMNSGATAYEYKSFATGTSGSDFAVAHSTNAIIFNLPDASASNRGVVTTGAQTIAGVKTLTSAPILLASPAADPGQGNFTSALLLRGADSTSGSPYTGTLPTVYLQTFRAGTNVSNFGYLWNYNSAAQGDNYVNYTLATINPNMSGAAVRDYYSTVDRNLLVMSPTNFGSLIITGYAGLDEGRRTVANVRTWGREIDVATFTFDAEHEDFSSRNLTANLVLNQEGDAHNSASIVFSGAIATAPYKGLKFNSNATIRHTIDFKDNFYTLQGTVAVTNGSGAIVGTGTKFLTQLKLGDQPQFIGVPYTVTLITDDTHATIDPPYAAANNSGLTIAKYVTPIRLAANSFITAENPGGSAEYRLVGLNNSSTWSFDPDARSVTFGGIVQVPSPFLLGGNTAAFPSLKRSGTTVQFRLANDSGDAPISALDAAFSGTLSVTGHATLEGVTSTGATGTGKLVFDTGSVMTGGSRTGLTALGIRSTGAAFDLTFATSEVLTAGRTLSFVLNDAARTLTIPGSTTVPISSQAVTIAGPTAARTYTFPDAAATIARIDAGQTFTGTQAFGSLTVSGTYIHTSSSAAAFSIGPNGDTNPVLRIITNTASQADGVSLNGLAAGSGTVITALSSGSSSPISLVSKGTAGVVLQGTGTNDDAAAGKIGEVISSTIAQGSAISLTSNTAANLTSISLTAGDWDVWVEAVFSPGATTAVALMTAGASTTSATLNFASGNFYQAAPGGVTPANPWSVTSGPTRLSLSSTTTVYGVVSSTFSTSTMSAWGILRARRVR